MHLGRGGLLKQTVRFGLQRLAAGGGQLRFGLVVESQFVPRPREISVRHRRQPMLRDRPLQTASRRDRFSSLQIVHALLPIRHGLRAGLGRPQPARQYQNGSHAYCNRGDTQQPPMPPPDQLPPHASARARFQMREHFAHIRKAPPWLRRHAL